jgi:hypothetical protein
MSSFFDFANAAREKSRLTTNPFTKQIDFAPQAAGPSIRLADPNPPMDAPEKPPFTQFTSQHSKKVTFALPDARPAANSADHPEVITEENIEQEIKKLYEGFQTLQNWASSEAITLEKLKDEISTVETEISAFVKSAREFLEPS